MAHAQAGVAPQRLLIIHRPDGTTLGTSNDARWWPSGGTTGWTASPLLSSFTDGKIASLQDKMVVLRGLSCPRNMNWLGDKHGAGFLGMLTPPLKDVGDTTWPKLPTYTPQYQLDPNSKSITASDESIDQLFLRQIPALKGACPVPSAQLTSSTESADRMTSIPYGGSCVRVTSYMRPPAGAPMTQGGTVVPVPIAAVPRGQPDDGLQELLRLRADGHDSRAGGASRSREQERARLRRHRSFWPSVACPEIGALQGHRKPGRHSSARDEHRRLVHRGLFVHASHVRERGR